MLLLAALALLGAAPEDVRAGLDIYATHCTSCHGADLRGTADGPPLRGVGAASVDWWVASGRMPASVPWVEADRKRAMFGQADVDRLVAYVTSVAPGGPPLPQVRMGTNLAHGRDLYEANCEHCHGASAQGEALADGWVAPGLGSVPLNAIAEAIRIGPRPMPRWDERTLSQNDVDDIAAYINTKLQTQPDDPGGLSLGGIGPVAEGIVAWIAGIGIIFAFVRAIGTND